MICSNHASVEVKDAVSVIGLFCHDYAVRTFSSMSNADRICWTVVSAMMGRKMAFSCCDASIEAQWVQSSDIYMMRLRLESMLLRVYHGLDVE
jgi:intracellular sulfur oxidation DsrE/DsrF family protein